MDIDLVVMPHNLEAERAVIGALFLDPLVYPKIRPLLTAQHFYDRHHQTIFQVLIERLGVGLSIDFVSLLDAMHATSATSSLRNALEACIDSVVTSAAVVSHAALVKREATRRAFIDVGQRLVLKGQRQTDDLEEFVREAQREMSTITSEAEGIETGPLLLTAADQINPENVEWAWAGRIPIGSVSVLAGMPDLGKSTMTIQLSAQWSKGEAEGAWKGRPVDVVIASAEDCAATTIIPRLMAAGADLARVHLVSVKREGLAGNIAIPDDLDAVSNRMRDTHAKALIIDPLMAHLPGTVNAHRDQDVRRAIAPLARLAEELHAVVLTVMHLNKTQASEVLMRIGGSIGIPAAARSVLLAAHNPDDPDSPTKLLGHVKCNVAPKSPTLQYEIQGRSVSYDGRNIFTSEVLWSGVAEGVCGADLLAMTDREGRTALAEAKDWLSSILEEGSKPSDGLYKEGERLGFSKSTLRRAKDALGIVAEKTKFSGKDAWVWTAPPACEGAHTTSEDAQIRNNEHLGKTDDKKRTCINNLAEGAQRFDNDHLRDEVEHLRQPEEVIVDAD